MNKTIEDFVASMLILEENVERFQEGFKPSYRVLATELRKLLCDRNQGKNISLLPRIDADLKYHKLQITKVIENLRSLPEGLPAGFAVALPGRLYVTEKHRRFKLLFAEPHEMMKLEPWLDQHFLGPVDSGLSIRSFIKAIADKEGAHSDSEYGESLEATKQIKYAEDDSRQHCIVGIATYLVEWIAINRQQGKYSYLIDNKG